MFVHNHGGLVLAERHEMVLDREPERARILLDGGDLRVRGGLLQAQADIATT